MNLPFCSSLHYLGSLAGVIVCFILGKYMFCRACSPQASLVSTCFAVRARLKLAAVLLCRTCRSVSCAMDARVSALEGRVGNLSALATSTAPALGVRSR